MWAEEQGFADNPAAIAGATLFAESGCANCHTYLGDGTSNLGAPDLSDIGATAGRREQFFALRCRTRATSGTSSCRLTAGAGGAFTDKQLKQVGEFLAASKGPG